MKDDKIDDTYVYSRIGMALISAQRVEFLTANILEHLSEHNKYFSTITSAEFLQNTKKAMKARKMLGETFRILKLNTDWVIEDKLDEYLKKRNLLVHGFWNEYLSHKSEEQTKIAIDFCNDFGQLSNKIESFFKGFLYFLALRYVEDKERLHVDMRKWDNDFEYFIKEIKSKKLLD